MGETLASDFATESTIRIVGADPLCTRMQAGEGAVRVVVKDNFAIAGLPTSQGSARFARSAPATRGAVVIDRLTASGMAVIGRARMHELAYGVTGRNDWQGTPRNPLWPDRIVGGSSSGCAAAIASGAADLAIGTDTGGSIRMPAACCGIAGLKPTFGLVSRSGVLPEHSSLDCIGPMAATVAGIEVAMAAIAPGFQAAEVPSAPRLAVIECPVDSEVSVAFQAITARIAGNAPKLSLTHLDAAFEAGLTIIGAEMWAEYAWLAPDFEGIGKDVADRLRRAATIDCMRVASADVARAAFTEELDGLFARFDFLILPTLPSVPPLLADAENAAEQLRLTRLVRPFNVSGHPALTVPALTADGLPMGVQIVGAKGADAALCAFGRAVECKIELMMETRS